MSIKMEIPGRKSLEGSENWEEFAGGFEELGGIRWRVRRIGRNSLEGLKNWEHLATGFEAPVEFASGAGKCWSYCRSAGFVQKCAPGQQPPKTAQSGASGADFHVGFR